MAATTSSAHVHYGATAEKAPALAGEATPRGRRSALLVSVALVACAAAASARHVGRARTRLAASTDDGRGHKVHNNQIDDDKTYVVDDNIYDNGTIPSGCAWRGARVEWASHATGRGQVAAPVGRLCGGRRGGDGVEEGEGRC